MGLSRASGEAFTSVTVSNSLDKARRGRARMLVRRDTDLGVDIRNIVNASINESSSLHGQGMLAS